MKTLFLSLICMLLFNLSTFSQNQTITYSPGETQDIGTSFCSPDTVGSIITFEIKTDITNDIYFVSIKNLDDPKDSTIRIDPLIDPLIKHYNIRSNDISYSISDLHTTVPMKGNIYVGTPLSVTSTNGLCSGSASVTGGVLSSTYTYSWSNTTQTTQTINGLKNGTYTVTVTGDNGCSVTSSVNITNTDNLSVSKPDYNSTNKTLTANPNDGTEPYTYKWCDSKSQTISTINPLTITTNSTYTVTVTDNNKCTATSSYTVSDIVGINNIISTDFNIYYNQNLLTIKSNISEKCNVSVYDLSGRIIYNRDTQLNEPLNIDLNDNNIYIVRIMTKYGNIISKKIIK